MMSFSDERGAELRELFFETYLELLQALNRDALQLEKTPDDVGLVRSIRRTVHTLKGDAAACAFHELSELAHAMEDALAMDGIPSGISLPEVAFTAADAFDSMVSAYRGGVPLPSPEPLLNLLRQITPDLKVAVRTEKTETASDEATESRTEKDAAAGNALLEGKHVYRVTAHLDPLCAMPIAARQMVLNALSSMGEVLGAQSQSNLTQATKHLTFTFVSDRTAGQIAANCRIPTIISQMNVEETGDRDRPGGAEVSERPESATALPANGEATGNTGEFVHSPEVDAHAVPQPPAAENILRVDARRVDSVLDLVGELIINKSALQQVLQEVTRYYPKEPFRGRLADAVAFQSRVLNELQRSVMKVRMVPVEQLFRRFPRMLRDIAKVCGKDVDLLFTGEGTDLDKTLLDAIAEPLAHLVRNAVSHGIESPGERVRCGKPPRGSIRLEAYHQGNQVILEVSDDGHGIDVQRVKAKALEQKALTPEQASKMSEAELLQLVFRPGLSTAPTVNEISGRGVGLDVVHSVLSRLKGTVEIVTRPGQGTTFRLRLPLTLAIIKALLFRVANRLYAVPLTAVAEISRATEADLHVVDNREVLQSRGQILQIVRLGGEIGNDRSDKIFVLVISFGERKLGLVVDQLAGEEELVIKALDDQTVDSRVVSGASILGDGRVVLILNLATIIERAAKTVSPDSGEARAGILVHDLRNHLSSSEARR
jgi:two-component system chemotaxis sensor kinase CheA